MGRFEEDDTGIRTVVESVTSRLFAWRNEDSLADDDSP